MKRLIVLFALSGCASLGIGSPIDPVAAEQNRVNVVQIVGENDGFWAASGKPASLIQAAKDRNAAAVDLATKLGK